MHRLARPLPMFASRSLFQTAIPIGNPPRQGATGINHSSPFLNTWANSQAATAPLAEYSSTSAGRTEKQRSKDERRQYKAYKQQQKREKHSMAAVSDIYGFVPKDCKPTTRLSHIHPQSTRN